MNGDFAAELDAALNAHLDRLKEAADAARARIDDGAAALVTATTATAAEFPPVADPSPMFFDDEEPGSRAAVSFDLPDEPIDLEADAEGIPLPEE